MSLFRVGNEYRQRELHARHGGARQQGIAPSLAILLVGCACSATDASGERSEPNPDSGVIGSDAGGTSASDAGGTLGSLCVTSADCVNLKAATENLSIPADAQQPKELVACDVPPSATIPYQPEDFACTMYCEYIREDFEVIGAGGWETACKSLGGTCVDEPNGVEQCWLPEL